MPTHRIHNFNPGPAAIPLPVIEKARAAMLNYKNSGIGVMEISHRSKDGEEIMSETKRLLKSMLGFSDNYEVFFCTGGATQQFSIVPMNLLKAGSTANYIVTGLWGKKALQEAKKFGDTFVSASTEPTNFSVIPEKFSLSPKPAYLHFTSNDTIEGVQWPSEPVVDKNVPLICDASSDILSRSIQADKYSVLYAGAQKNLGAAGVTIVIVKKEHLGKLDAQLPILLDYRTYSENDSLYNTPPVFAIYTVLETLRWVEEQGGLNTIEKINQKKAALLYSAIDEDDYYTGYAEKKYRSLMNVTFRLRTKDLDLEFAKVATEAGLFGLKGHKVFGGLRASLYNAVSLNAVEDLVQFMRTFKAKNQ